MATYFHLNLEEPQLVNRVQHIQSMYGFSIKIVITKFLFNECNFEIDADILHSSKSHELPEQPKPEEKYLSCKDHKGCKPKVQSFRTD